MWGNVDKVGCDLLSFHYLCAIRNSYPVQKGGFSVVVICFHFIIFVLLGTARIRLHIYTHLL